MQNNKFYRNSLQQLTAALYGQLATIEVAGREYSFSVWTGQQLPDRLIALDTETRKIEGREVPQLALVQVAGDQGSCYFIHPTRLAQFIKQHAQAFFCCHNAVFDFWVVAQHLQTEPAALAAWWGIAGDSRLCCSMLTDQLIQLARVDAQPRNRNLAVVAWEYCRLRVDKNDPYRLRYGELIGIPETAWPDQEPGFWSYGGADPIATLLVMQAQGRIADQLLAPHRNSLLPVAERRYGPLTACLQVQGAIALEYASKVGISVDTTRSADLHADITDLVEQAVEELEDLAGVPLFKRYKRTGKIKRTRNGIPQRDAMAIKTHLEQIAKEAEEPIKPPKLKNGTISDAALFWSEYTQADPFIETYCRFIEQSKLAQFFAALSDSQVYPRYKPLVKTGRTSCSKPNLQQLPRDGRFRAMITAPPGYCLLQIDYSVLELRTLAAICLRRYGRSKMAELFNTGADLHKHTAAQLLGLSTEQFAELSKAEQKQHRQRAKALNFGIPGGLGAKSLVAYAKAAYQVDMDLDEARAFRKRLVTTIYPELSAYLRDQPYETLAHNLMCNVATVRLIFPDERKLRDAWAIIAGEAETKGGDEYEDDLIAYVWAGLLKLNGNPELTRPIQAKQPGLELSRRIFWGHAITPTGRIRGHVGFTQKLNTPFSGLAADGNKLALFRLLRAGYPVCGFVHDEMLVLLRDGADYDAAVEDVQRILAEAMAELTPGIPIETEYLLADRWYKGIDDQPRDAAGKILPYKEGQD